MDTKKLREIAEWYDTTRTDAGYLFSGERGEASRAWHRAVTTQSILALLDENDSLRAEVERLRVLTLNPGATLHGSTIMEIADERNHLRQQLAAALAAKDEACDLAESFRAAVDRAEAWDQVHGRGDNPDVNYKHRIAALRSIGKDGGNE